jgi:hypothetical protein
MAAVHEVESQLPYRSRSDSYQFR